MATSQFLRSSESDTPYGQLPSYCRVKPQTCKIDIPAPEIAEIRNLVQKARLGPTTFENSQAQTNTEFGLTQSWMNEAVKTWTSETAFNWSVSSTCTTTTS